MVQARVVVEADVVRTTNMQAESHDIFGEEVARRLLRTYEQEGGALGDLLSGGSSALASDTVFPTDLHALPREVLTRICHRAVGYLAARESRRAGRTPLRATDWRVLLYSLASGATLREAIERSAECFEAIDWRCGRMGLRVAGRRAELHLDAGPMTSGPASALITLYGVVVIHELFSAAIGRFLPVEQISIGYKAEQFNALHLPPLPFTLVPDATWDGFAFPATYLDHPIVCSVSDLSARAPRNLLFYQDATDISAEPIGSVLRRLTMRALKDRQKLPRFEEIARELAGSAATIRRRLAAEGLTYREIKNSCRRELGLDLLRSTSLSIEDIAARLDFCDSDAFRVAFHDWFGMPPSRYRGEITTPSAKEGLLF